MKKLFLLSLFLFGMHTVLPAQNRLLEKERKKEYKKKMKEFKKNRMKVTGTSRSLEVALLTHYDKIDKGYEEIQVITDNCPSMNLCDRKALTDACSKYATLANSFVRGKVNSEASFDAAENKTSKTDQDKFYAAYEQKVSANLAGVLKRSFSAYKKKGKIYTYETYYLVETDAAKSARQKAFEQALAETKANQEWANSISDFIDDKPEEN